MARHSDGIIDRTKGAGQDMSALTGMSADLHVTRNYSDMGVFAEMQVEKPADQPLYVTDFTDQTFKVDSIKAVDMSAAAGTQGASIQNNVAECEKTKNNYLQADADIKENITAACKEVLGAEEGKRFADHLFPDGQPTMFQAAAVTVDPTGVAGSIWSVVNAVQKQNDRFGTEDTRRILDQVLNKLQEASQQKQEMTVFETRKTFELPNPDYKFDKVQTPEQLLDFCRRDVMQDPVMQELEDSLENARRYEENMDYNKAHEGQDFTAGRLAAEIAAGNNEFIEKVADSDAEAQAIEACSAYAVEIVREGLQQPPHIGLKEGLDLQFASVLAVQSADAKAADTFGVALNNNQENKLAAMAMGMKAGGKI